MNSPLNKTAATPEAEVIYSSHPVNNYRVGKFKFEKSLLKLTGDDIEIFESLLASMPVTEQNKVQKLDVAAAEALIEANRVPGATKQTDSSTGERGSNATGPRIGIGALENLNKPAS